MGLRPRDEVDRKIRELWLFFAKRFDQSSNRLRLFTDDDIDVWTSLTKHPAVQGVLEENLSNDT